METRAVNEWKQIDELYWKVLQHFYRRNPDLASAKKYATELRVLLDRHRGEEQAILLHSAWSLYWELYERFDLAIEHRVREIALIKRFLELCGPDNRYHASALSLSMDVLARLYDATGEEAVAIRTLQESEKLCRVSDVRFEGRELLDELLQGRKHGGRR